MFDLAAITSAGASLKTAADLAKAFMDVKVAVEVQGKVFDMQRAILAAQQDLFSAQEAQAGLVDENRKLLERIKAWDVERQRFALRMSAMGRWPTNSLRPRPRTNLSIGFVPPVSNRAARPSFTRKRVYPG